MLVTGNSGVNSLNTKLELNPGVVSLFSLGFGMSIVHTFGLMGNPWCPLIVMPQPIAL